MSYNQVTPSFWLCICVNFRLCSTHFSCHWCKICHILCWSTQISKRQHDPCLLSGNKNTTFHPFCHSDILVQVTGTLESQFWRPSSTTRSARFPAWKSCTSSLIRPSHARVHWLGQATTSEAMLFGSYDDAVFCICMMLLMTICEDLALVADNTQGMTIRTARLPRAGNLLSWAGEDLSGLPDQASCYQFVYFFYFFLLTVSYYNSSTRFQVTVTIFVFAVPQSQHQFPFTSSNWPTSVSWHVIGLPVQLSQSEASSLYSWRSMAHTQLF